MEPLDATAIPHKIVLISSLEENLGFQLILMINQS